MGTNVGEVLLEELAFEGSPTRGRFSRRPPSGGIAEDTAAALDSLMLEAFEAALVGGALTGCVQPFAAGASYSGPKLQALWR